MDTTSVGEPELEAANSGMAAGRGASTDPWSWGANWYGELGTGPNAVGGPTPVQIAGWVPLPHLN